LLCPSATTTHRSLRREDPLNERREVVKAEVSRCDFWAPGVPVSPRTATHQDSEHACSFNWKDVIVDPVTDVGDAGRLDSHIGADSLEEGG